LPTACLEGNQKRLKLKDSIDVLAYANAIDRNTCKIDDTKTYLVLQPRMPGTMSSLCAFVACKGTYQLLNFPFMFSVLAKKLCWK